MTYYSLTMNSMSDFIKYITWLIYFLIQKTPADFDLWYHKINFERKIHQSTEFDILLWSWHSLLEMLENVRFSSRFKSNNFQSLSSFVKKSRKKKCSKLWASDWRGYGSNICDNAPFDKCLRGWSDQSFWVCSIEKRRPILDEIITPKGAKQKCQVQTELFLLWTERE